MMWRTFFAGTLLALLVGCGIDGKDLGPPRPESPVPTPTGLVDASDPQPISDIAWRYGEATWGPDGFRDPVIEATLTDGTPYRIEFYGCEEGRNCREIRFVAETGAKWPPAKLARWNRTRRFGKVTLGDDEVARVEMNAVLQGGITRQNLDALFDWWVLVLADFVRGPDG